MHSPYLNKIIKIPFGLPLLVLLAGLAWGFSILFFFSRFSATFATIFTAAILFPCAAIVFGNTKRFLLMILTILLPITVDRVIDPQINVIGGGGANGYLISFYDIVLAALYFLWLIELIHKTRKRICFFPQITTPFLCLIGIACMSMLTAPLPNMSMYEIIELIKMYLSFLYLTNNIRTKEDVMFIAFFLLLGLFFEGVMGFLQHRYKEPFFPTSLGGPAWVRDRVKGTWENYNDFSWYLTFLLPLSMSMLFPKMKYVQKIMIFTTLLLGSVSLIWTRSRAGWISITVAGLFTAFFVFYKIKGKRNLIHIFASMIAVLILFSPVFPAATMKLTERFLGDDGGSAESRIPHMQVAFNIIQAHPFIGIGLNNYTEVMYDYDDTEEGLSEYSRFPVHNIYLHMTAEMGIFGLFVFVWLILAIFNTGLSYIIENEIILVYVVIAFLAGILAFLIHGLADTASIGNKLFLFLWFFTGIIFAVGNMTTESNRNKK